MKDFINFIKDFLLGFLLTWYALDLWKLFQGEICPLWRKGIDVDTRQAHLHGVQVDLHV